MDFYMKNILKKISELIKRIFNKPQLIEEHSKNQSYIEQIDNKEKMKKELIVDGIEDLNEKMYKKINYEKSMNEIIGIIEKRPRLLKTLDIEKLEQVKKFYEKKNEELDLKIKKLKKINA